MKKLNFLFAALIGVMFTLPAIAQDVGITKEMKSIEVETADGLVKIERNQDQNATIHPDFAKTSRPCPSFCVQPMKVAEGVETVGEVEILEMLRDKKALLIDARTEEWHFKGTIPSSVNIPYIEITQRMSELGCEDKEGKMSCENAKSIILFCNGPWCGQSPTAIRALLREGYPAEKLFYYRGGMQAWHALGLTVVEGGL